MNDAADWWRNAVVYEIYPRSFADSDADGVGDLNGITSRVDYLRELGIDAVWLTPFYRSPLADGGYDVEDYRSVDPLLGTLDDFDRMTAALHAAGIKVIVDVVANHSSALHPWFKQALAAAPGSPERDRYIFRDGVGPNRSEPPSDWQSEFGGPAWHPAGDGQFYLHLFAPEQPDFNWSNREVQDDFITTLRFWTERGVDGFRIDAAHTLAKDLTEPFRPWAEIDKTVPLADGSHPLWDRDEVHQIYAQWRAALATYDPPPITVAEAWVQPHRRGRYAASSSLGQAFNFDLTESDFTSRQFRDIIAHNLADADAVNSAPTWVLSNHDVVRHATRYGLPLQGSDRGGPAQRWLSSRGAEPLLDRQLGLDRARAAILLLLALPGSVYLYQGEELGLHEVVEIPDDARQDPTFLRSLGASVGRDGARVPLPWTSVGPSFGFGQSRPFLPQPAWFADASVQSQESDADSTLALYRAAIHFRRLRERMPLEWVDAADEVLEFTRGPGWRSVTNFGARPVALPSGSVVLASRAITDGMLPSNSTAWLT